MSSTISLFSETACKGSISQSVHARLIFTNGMAVPWKTGLVYVQLDYAAQVMYVHAAQLCNAGY